MILYIGNKLSKHGVTPTNVETLGAKLQEQFDTLLVSDKKNKIIRFFDAVFAIIRNRRKISLVFIDTYSTSNFYYTLVAALTCQLFKLPYVPILHGGGLPDRLKNSPGLCRMVFSKAAINISPSHYLMDAFRKQGYEVEYIPNYIDTENYPSAVRRKLRPKLLYVRSLHKIYNPEMAVKALKALSGDYPEIELCMVGPDKDGSKASVEQLAASLGVSDKLTLTGRLSKEAWIKLSDEYDVFINTTNFDNLPVSIIEAMCLGFPVVSTNAGGLPYLIEDQVDGMLVDLDDDQAMVSCIKRLMEDAELAESISKTAIEKGKSFDWERIRGQWDALISRMALKEKLKASGSHEYI
ncbi:glycosyltransferase family 4 protein [Fulvivirgaceae bacterium BMA12]|uniref:Glycosyltransferase family 4 protein n=1 Tax=Agaribacillus aureus TaxID=3051825 RepID=A0ABT8KZR4_9BACT|nr:glycosyltransferase family 4 protein [Fulvivirgaceae bacterium BMA12]